MAHAILAPSAAKRWIACPGSVALAKRLGVEDSTAGQAADEGTVLHAIADRHLRTGLALEAQKGPYTAAGEPELGLSPRFLFHVGDDEIALVRGYVEYVQAIAELHSEAHAEQKLDLTTVLDVEGQFGTSDFVALSATGIDVVDLKTGRNPVDPGGWQNLLYAAGVIEKYDPLYDFEPDASVALHIYQPRCGAPTCHKTTVGEIRALYPQIRASARQAMAAYEGAYPGTALIPLLNVGEHCEAGHCKARAQCPAFQRVVAETALEGFAEIGDSPAGAGADDFEIIEDAVANQPVVGRDAIAALSEKTLALWYPRIKAIQGFCEDVLARCKELAMQGQPVEGTKLVVGRAGAREWSDADAAEELLKGARLKADEMYTKQLVTPTQAEKLLKERPRVWAKVSGLVVQKEGNLTLVAASDKRPAVVVNAVDDFDDISGDADIGCSTVSIDDLA